MLLKYSLIFPNTCTDHVIKQKCYKRCYFLGSIYISNNLALALAITQEFVFIDTSMQMFRFTKKMF